MICDDATHEWHPGTDAGVWRCVVCGAVATDAETRVGAPADAAPLAYHTPPPIYPSLADAERAIRRQERERCAALLRAYADTRPAGEAYALLRLCATMEAAPR